MQVALIARRTPGFVTSTMLMRTIPSLELERRPMTTIAVFEMMRKWKNGSADAQASGVKLGKEEVKEDDASKDDENEDPESES